MLYIGPMEQKDTLGRRIAHARTSGVRRMTQAEIARELGVSPQAVSGWERNEAMPELDKFGKLADLLGTSIIWLMEGTGEGPPRYYMEQSLKESEQRLKRMPVPSRSLVGAADFPVYAATQGGSGVLVIHSDVMEYVRRPVLLDGVPESYGILVMGDSMVPSYRPGDLALVHPRKPPQRDTDVILYKTDHRTGDAESMIKRLTGFNDKIWRLEQYQPAKSFSEPRSEWPICHQVVGRYNSR